MPLLRRRDAVSAGDRALASRVALGTSREEEHRQQRRGGEAASCEGGHWDDGISERTEEDAAETNALRPKTLRTRARCASGFVRPAAAMR